MNERIVLLSKSPFIITILLIAIFSFCKPSYSALITDTLKMFEDAEQGDPEAQYELAKKYSYTLDPNPYAMSLHWFTKAAEQGHNKAQYELGLMYYRGYGVSQDYIKAYIWFNIAGSSNNLLAIDYRDYITERLDKRTLIEAQKISSEYFDLYVKPFQKTKGLTTP